MLSNTRSLTRADVREKHAVTIFGDGDVPLVLAHGFGCDQNIWQRVIPLLDPKYCIITFDYVGCGRSDMSAYHPTKYRNLDDYAADLITILDAFDLSDVEFIGHSVSGTIGMLASIERPELFAHIVGIAPSPCYLNDGPDYQGGFSRNDINELLDMMERNYFEWAGYLAPLVMENPDRPELTHELKDSFVASPPEVVRQFAKVTFLSDVRDRLPQVTVPVTLLHCESDVIVPNQVIHYLAKRLRNSQTAQLQAHGHYPHMSNPDAVADAIHVHSIATPQTFYHGY